jgi:hypothetical protein
MSGDRRAQFEIDVGTALDAIEAATFDADELLNCVLIRKRMPTDRRIEAFQDAAEILHHNLHAMRLVRLALERRHTWPDRLQETRAVLSNAIEDMKEAKSHLALAFFVFEAAADPTHWSNIEQEKYAAAFNRVNTALEKVTLAIERLSYRD